MAIVMINYTITFKNSQMGTDNTAIEACTCGVSGCLMKQLQGCHHVYLLHHGSWCFLNLPFQYLFDTLDMNEIGMYLGCMHAYKLAIIYMVVNIIMYHYMPSFACLLSNIVYMPAHYYINC